MRQYCIALILFTSLFGAPLSVQANSSLNSETKSSVYSKGSFNVLVKAIGNWQDLRQQKTEKKIALTYEEGLVFPSLKEIERIEVEMEKEEVNLERLNTQYLILDTQEEQDVFLDSIKIKQNELDALLLEKKGYEETYVKRKEKQQVNIKQFKEDLEDLQEGIDKQKKVIEVQLSQTFTWILFIIGIIIFLLGLKFISTRIVSHFSSRMSEQRQQVLLRVFRISFNVVIIIVLIGTVSSQFMSLLPFLALLGTGIAFAVRDALSSFLAWFLIGGENGYRVGNIIRVGKCYGKVHEITPFLTFLKEIKGDHETGEIITFPNNVVFGQEIRHFSRYNGFVNKEVLFLIDENTDIEKAKSLLLEVIQEIIVSEREEYGPQLERLVKNFSLKKEETQPVAWCEQNDHGINLLARFLTRLEEASFTKKQVEEEFIKRVQQSKNIQFHFIDIGRTQHSFEQLANENGNNKHFH